MLSKIDHNYLHDQFNEPSEILAGIREVVRRGDFTLGKEVELFEKEFAAMCGVKHAIGVGNGTDALFLALKTLGVKHGPHEVITTPYSFYATTATIVNAGAKPVFVDVDRDFNIDVTKLEKAITPHTVGIVPVHWAGRPCNMNAVMGIAKVHGLWVLEDCAHAPNSVFNGRKCGSFGDMAAFSLHPLKNVNVWGDGGLVVTNNDAKADHVRKLRNHGMADRNTAELWGYNSRLDTVQAVVGRHVVARIETITERRRANAAFLNRELAGIDGVDLPRDRPDSAPNYYLYTFHAERRDELQKFLIASGIDAKVHYPTPLHLQPAAKSLGHKRGDFPIAEWCADSTISLPVHDYLTPMQLERMALLVREFYEAA